MEPSSLRFLGLGESLVPCRNLWSQTWTDDPPLFLRKIRGPEPTPPVPLEFQPTSPGQKERLRRLRLCTWNVLAPSYALHKSFPDVKPETLTAVVSLRSGDMTMWTSSRRQ
ncbi:unnamed protein product [Cladocopium goreaui]|uniref:Uncharacterized protein n=1 Tax=Cladocopium goreaui TaxID=2562237 RepID=A0A9P1M451_9DINO|nr:unnamed protein product [Cladocopium goreaui]